MPYADNQARADAEAIDAKVLSNRKPPFSLAGGLYDALKDTHGDVLKVDNRQAKAAQELFERTEGIDIHPAPAVALHSLIESVQNGTVKPDDCVMLNITGGGEKRMKSDKQVWNLQPSKIYPLAPDPDRVVKEAEDLFATI